MSFINGNLFPLAHAARIIVALNIEKPNLISNTKNS